MQNKFLRNGLIVITLVAVVGLGSYAFADWGSGSPRGGGKGAGLNARNDNGRGLNAMRGLTEEETQKVRAAQEKFRADTDILRQDIFAKQMALKSELAQRDTDAKKAIRLQKELSELKAQFDEKRLAHRLALKEINPKLGLAFGGRGGGPGHGHRGGGPGAGPRGGGGYCWQ